MNEKTTEYWFRPFRFGLLFFVVPTHWKGIALLLAAIALLLGFIGLVSATSLGVLHFLFYVIFLICFAAIAITVVRRTQWTSLIDWG